MFMISRNLFGGVALAIAAALPLISVQPLCGQVPQDDAAVQTRGPIHEAFAELADVNPSAGIIVPQQPPEPINELPPEVKPAGDVTWIPGYWAWDDERNDFLWVSGVWRLPPPGTTWVPGYWAQVEGGFQWVPGFWTSEQELTYLPPPPPSLENGPASPPPGDNYFYVPGSWVLVDGRYAWQPGYWAPYQTGWVWINARYVCTPSGYCYIPGRWDLPFNQRGYCFAPAYFTGQSYLRPGFAYRPSVFLNTTWLATMLFARPNYGSWYFGDYYGQNYAQAGYQPWYAYRYGGQTLNPMFAYERWSNRTRDPQWEARIRNEFDRRFADESARPPRDWQRWQEGNRGNVTAQASSSNPVFVSVQQAVTQNVGDRPWVARRDDDRDARWRELREFQNQRKSTELQARTNTNPAVQPGAAVGTNPTGAQIRPSMRLRLPPQARTHVTARPIDQTGAEAQPGRTVGEPPRVDRSNRPDRVTRQEPPTTTQPSTTPPPPNPVPSVQPPTTQPPTVPTPTTSKPTDPPSPRDNRPGRLNRPGAAEPRTPPPMPTPRAGVPGTPPVQPPTLKEPATQPATTSPQTTSPATVPPQESRPQRLPPQMQTPRTPTPTVQPPQGLPSVQEPKQRPPRVEQRPPKQPKLEAAPPRVEQPQPTQPRDDRPPKAGPKPEPGAAQPEAPKPPKDDDKPDGKKKKKD